MSRINFIVIGIVSIVFGFAAYFIIFYDLTPTTIVNDIGISARVVHGIDDRIMCPISPCDTSIYLLVVNSNLNSMVTGYNICKGISCIKDNNLSVFVGPENDPRNQQIYLQKDTTWQVGDIVNIRLRVAGAAVADGKYYPDPHKTIYLDLGNSKVVEDPRVFIATALDVARNFVQSSPTFGFDGIAESLRLGPLGATDVGVRIDATFNSKHEGYGDRTGKKLEELDVIHTMNIWVENGKVIYAYTDGQWDELNQKPISPEPFKILYKETNSTFLDVGQTKYVKIQCRIGDKATSGGYEYVEEPKVSVPFSDPINENTAQVKFVNTGNTSGSVHAFVICERTQTP